MKAFVLAGGSGTRLFPLSNKNYPKQFLKLFGDKTMIQSTMNRILSATDGGDVYIITGERFVGIIKEQLKGYEKYKLITEPCGRNTAPAIALGLKYLMDVENVKKGVVGVFPSDHYINPVSKFKEYVKIAEKLAEEGYIVTFGIVPKKPETGYGYIEADESKKIYENAYEVKKFHEKPSYTTAEEYLKRGNFYWNSGMFVFRLDVMLEEFKKHVPELHHAVMNKSYEKFVKGFKDLQSISIDYAVMEKTDRAAVVVMHIVWSDVGSWDSVYELLDKDENHNAVVGKAKLYDVRNSLVFNSSEGKKIYVIGLENVAVIQTDDSVLIVNRSRAQDVRKVAE